MPDPASPSERRAGLAAALPALAAWVILAWAAFLPFRPPDAVPGVSPERIAADVAILARGPHPTGSAAVEEVRRHLVQRLAAEGLEPSLQKVSGTGPQPVVNVLARLEGSGTGDALLLAAHHDSVPGSPGAADNGAAVAALLEVAGALAAGEPRHNDVIFLFSDSEERNREGARGFLAEHPWAEDVRVVANFDAVGSRGPSVLYRTRGPAAPAVAALAASPRPAASSLGEELFAVLNHATDLDSLAGTAPPGPAPVPGLDFALVLGSTVYHRETDVPAALDLRSALHHASHALALAEDLGDADLGTMAEDGEDEGGVVYFALPPSLLVRYPAPWAPWMALGLLVALVAAGELLVRRRQVGRGRMLVEVGLAPLLALAGAGLVALLHAIVVGAGGGPSAEPWESVALGGWALVGVGSVLALRASGGEGRPERRPERETVRDAGLAGAATAWAVLALVTAVALPGASYLFLAAGGAGLAALAVLLPGRPAGAVRRGLAAVVAGGALLAWVPALRLAASALRNGWLAAVVAGGGAALLATLLLPPGGIVPQGRRGWVAAALVVVAGTAVATAALHLS